MDSDYSMPALKEALAYATRVANRMWNDPEAEAVASWAAWKAHSTYDGRIRWKNWVAHVVKMDVWAQWRNQRYRKAKERTACEEWWVGIGVETQPEAELPISREAWQMLVEHHVDGWALDVIAKRHGMPKSYVKQRMQAAAELLDRKLCPGDAIEDLGYLLANALE